MKNWSQQLKSSTRSGVYTVTSPKDLPDIKQSARVYGLAFIYIDLSGIVTKDAFLQVVSRALQFPDYFGMNWDAFEDCITDLSWFSSRGYVFVIANIEEFAQKVPRELQKARNIFRSAAEFWEKQEIPFFVLLVKDKYKSSTTSSTVNK